MSDLRDLYQQAIVDHSKNPRNFRKLEESTQKGIGHNPLCGDRLTLWLKVADGVIEDVSFEGEGCAISTAAASMMTEAIKGKRREEVQRLFTAMHELLTSDPNEEKDTSNLGKLVVFEGVCEFPVRVKCASLAWHTLQNALGEGSPEGVISTE